MARAGYLLCSVLRSRCGVLVVVGAQSWDFGVVGHADGGDAVQL